MFLCVVCCWWCIVARVAGAALPLGRRLPAGSVCRSEREGVKGGAKKHEKSIGTVQNDGNARAECNQGGGVLEEELEGHSDESFVPASPAFVLPLTGHTKF